MVTGRSTIHDESAFKWANTAVCNQVGQPPPAAVLVALIETVGGTPDVPAEVVDYGDGYTTGDVFACRGDVIAHVAVTTCARNLSDVPSSSGEPGGHPGFHR